MKTLTHHISKYHFIKIGVLLIGLMWSSNIVAQSDSTVTYTFNDTTMTFNLEDIRESLLNSTDLSPQEVEATLLYEPFWRSMFPPPPPNPNSIAPISNNVIRDINDPRSRGRSGGGPDDGCIGFDNMTETESTGNNPTWVTQVACITPEQVGPLTYQNTPWAGGQDCGHTTDEMITPYFGISQGAFAVIPSQEDTYDEYVSRNNIDKVIEMKAPSGNSHFIRIGDRVGGYHAHRIVGKFTVPQDKPMLKYNYALALQDVINNHGGTTLDNTGRPYFTIKFRAKNPDTGVVTDVPCGAYSVVGVATPNAELDTDGIIIGQNVGADSQFPGVHNGAVVNWKENIINLTPYKGWEVEVEASITECNEGGHTAWAYLDFSCEEGSFEVNKEAEGCSYNFTTEYTGNYGTGNEEYLWDFDDGNTSTSPDPSHTYSESGDYEVTLTIEYTNYPNGNDGTNGETCEVTFSETVTICCDACESSFSPLPGEEYVISAWVKEDIAGVLTYDNPNITLQFEGSYTSEGPFRPSGAIIDGWQRIEAEFTIPNEAEKIKIKLNNDGNNNVFFDDVRVHPFDASMKSFVYDPVTLRLSAELDERNYATYYEYDEEGALIRIKKETERGVMTIQEARNGIRKAND